MDLKEMKLGDVLALANCFQQKTCTSSILQIGQNYMVQTVTKYYTGRLVSFDDMEIVLEDVAWIASEGRVADSFKKGEFDEVEPFPDGLKVAINRGSVVAYWKHGHSLPRSQK